MHGEAGEYATVRQQEIRLQDAPRVPHPALLDALERDGVQCRLGG